MKNRYLITGASGFVGSCITHKLVSKGEIVAVISRRKNPNWRLKQIENRIHFYSLDLRDKNLATLLKKISPTHIFHLAAYGSLPKENNFESMLNSNVFGTANLINCLDFTNIKVFINTGSSAEYKTTNMPFAETDNLLPLNDYGISKCAQTLLCQKEAVTKKLPIITLRLFSPYGYFEELSRLIPYVILNTLQNKDLLLSSKTFVRDFVFIEDVINAYLQVNTTNSKPGEIFNIGSGKQHSVEEVVKIVMKLTKSTSQLHWNKMKKQIRQTEPKTWQADIAKAQQILKWKPQYSLTEGLRSTIDWFKNQNSFYV